MNRSTWLRRALPIVDWAPGYQRALDQAKGAAKQFGSEEVRRTLGFAQLRTGDFEEALVTFGEMRVRGVERGDVYAGMALAHALKNERSLALGYWSLLQDLLSRSSFTRRDPAVEQLERQTRDVLEGLGWIERR